MKKFLICLLCVLPMHAGAEVLYRVQKTGLPADSVKSNDTFASNYRFYVGGMYDLSFWQKETGEDITLKGKTTSGFDAVAGFFQGRIVVFAEVQHKDLPSGDKGVYL